MGKRSTRWFRSGPLDVEVLRSGVLLSGHEARHVDGGADELSTLEGITPHVVGEVLAIISCSLDGPFTSTAVAATVVNYTDMILNISEFPANAKGVLRVVWKNSGNNTSYIDLYDQFGAAAVANSQITEPMAANVWELSETATPFALPAGLRSFQVRLWVSAGTVTVAKVELQIERAA